MQISFIISSIGIIITLLLKIFDNYYNIIKQISNCVEIIQANKDERPCSLIKQMKSHKILDRLLFYKYFKNKKILIELNNFYVKYNIIDSLILSRKINLEEHFIVEAKISNMCKIYNEFRYFFVDMLNMLEKEINENTMQSIKDEFEDLCKERFRIDMLLGKYF